MRKGQIEVDRQLCALVNKSVDVEKYSPGTPISYPESGEAMKRAIKHSRVTSITRVCGAGPTQIF